MGAEATAAGAAAEPYDHPMLAAALSILALAFPQTAPNDPLYDASPLPGATNEQWDLSSDRGIGADRAWPLSTGAGILIADIDVGVQLDHPDLAAQFDKAQAFDFYQGDSDPTSDTANAHGTNVAGVLAAQADNGLGIAGVAPGAKILPLRTSDNILHQGQRLAQAIVYAADHGARVMSMSLGADSFGSQLRAAVRYAHRKGSVMVVASGNEFHFHHHYPQLMDEVLAVGGLNPDSANSTALNPSTATVGTRFDVKAAYADFGPHLDVVAPTQVPTAEWGGGNILNWSGTSAATPHVAGTAALVLGRAKSLGIELSAGEVIQLIRMTATDMTASDQGFAPGWDRLSGWGRVDAGAAVAAVKPETIPPVPDLTAPEWYEPIRGGGAVRVRGTVTARTAMNWTLEIGDGEQPAQWSRIAGGSGTIISERLKDLRPGTHTLRLTVKDARGNRGEDRAFFRILDDPSLRRPTPLRLGTSGESSPQLAQLDRDPGLEIVLATADGRMTVLDGRTLKPERGWPRWMHSSPGTKAIAKRIGTVRPGFLATPAVGDVAGGPAPEIVAAGLDGRIYAWSARGRRIRGFPYSIRIRRPTEKGQLDATIYGSPALADLDADGKLDIVAGAADQHVYAVKGTGRDLAGWPVLARDGEHGNVAKILASPAIGDLDGDHSPDVVQATGEAYGSTPSTTGRVHAFDARGKPLPGWPVKPPALAADSIPLAGEGVPGGAVLADVDGDGRDEVAVAAFTGIPQLYRGDGTAVRGPGGTDSGHFEALGRGSGSDAGAPSILGLGANAAFGRLAKDGPVTYLSGIVDERLAAAQSAPASRIAFEHLAGAWNASSGEWLAAFPRVMEGWQIIAGPAVADVDGDGAAEAIFGGSGNVLHAFRADGSEPKGWPKALEGWLLAVPAIGDIDGDGKLEIVAVTRDGWLYTFDTPTDARTRTEWPAFRHDARNSGRYASSPTP
jgi:subtilisin family serine protease